ncbi:MULTISPECIES: hypothetical protein [unclassified Nostoc]|uniref:hypothetical protein n=1 Tax=unclassified Nostoc TaxID=2593658 RepID=UPI002AD5746A|nr:hypothetical protein [Nostoc sp. DedQUE03]MDZ7977219.1 hypothetical protein [Nostoc sp. DedQUE03]MDZ8047660.1 hypothetical protein [Nostoc sp. DedQUE02]
MAKRFNNLDAALKYLRSPSAGAEDLAPDAPAGSQLKKYQDFKAGKVKIDYTRASTSNPGNIEEVALEPFALPAASTDKYIVDISKRAKDNYTAAGVSEGVLNISATLTSATRVFGFTPARATVKNVTGTTASSATSKITGKQYKKKAAASYTFPFGSQASNGSFSEVKADIVAAVAGAGGNKGVSFKPEIFR